MPKAISATASALLVLALAATCTVPCFAGRASVRKVLHNVGPFAQISVPASWTMKETRGAEGETVIAFCQGGAKEREMAVVHHLPLSKEEESKPFLALLASGKERKLLPSEIKALKPIMSYNLVYDNQYAKEDSGPAPACQITRAFLAKLNGKRVLRLYGEFQGYADSDTTGGAGSKQITVYYCTTYIALDAKAKDICEVCFSQDKKEKVCRQERQYEKILRSLVW